jgi:CBS domain-containing protein
MTVKRLLDTKVKGVWTIGPDATVYDAVAMMVEHNVGALVVLDGDHVIGIVTERDYMRKMILAGKDPRTTRIRDIMTGRVLYVRPDQTVQECMQLMTERQVRHLPVIDTDRLIGILSIRDVVRDVVSDKEFWIEQLENYVMDRPPHLK